MPYGGKPSNGCYLCRQRKIKCDRLATGCMNCAKIKRTCPGYRNQIDLIFRSENDRAAEKSAKAEEKRKATLHAFGHKDPLTQGSTVALIESVSFDTYLDASPHGQDVSESSHCSAKNNEALLPSSSMTYYNLSPTVDDLALGFFFAHFVTGFPPREGSSISGMNDTLLGAVRAVGMIGVSRESGDPNLVAATQWMYVNAVSKTNQALRSAAVTEDCTLLAVMLLAIFETMTGCTKRSAKSWRDHINGAAALLELRGPDQLKHPDGIRLFIYAATALVTDCLREELHLPDYILSTAVELSKHVNQKDPGWRFFETSIAVTNFLADVWQGLLCDPELIIRKAFELDNRCLSMFSEATPEWAYEIVYEKQTNEDMPDKFHIYDSFISVQLWNGMRVMRFMLHEVVCAALARLSAASVPLTNEQNIQARLSIQSLYDIHSDILATVPQHLGLVTKGSATPSDCYGKTSPAFTIDPQFLWSHFPERLYDPSRGANLPLSQVTKLGFLPHLRTFGNNTLPWGLFLLGKSKIATPAVRIYVGKVLRTLGEHMGILQAVYLAQGF